MDCGMDTEPMRRLIGRLFLLVMALAVSPGAMSQSYEALRDSLEAATAMVKKFPDNTDLRLRKASWNMLLEQWDYAQAEYDFILSRNPRQVAALYYRAYTYEKQHKYKHARGDYEAMLKVVPGNFNGQLGLALLNQKDMHYTEAMDMINRLVEQYPDSAVAYAARAGMEAERGLLELAEYDFTEAIRLDPVSTDYLISRADIRLRKGDKRKAKEDLDNAVKAGVPRPSLSEFYARCR